MILGANLALRAVLLLGSAILLGACSIPLHVARVTDREAETKGVRYLLRRPGYAVSLRFEGTDPKGCRFKIQVDQTMDADPLEFEAVGEVEVFADTEIEVTQQDDGTLSGFTAGATDRSVEAIQTLAGIAAKLASPLGVKAQRDEDPGPCGDRGLSDYAIEHDRLQQDLRMAMSVANDQSGSLGPRSGAAKVRNIRELENLVEGRAALVAEHVFPLNAERAHVYLGERLVQGDAKSTPWVTVTLTEVSP